MGDSAAPRLWVSRDRDPATSAVLNDGRNVIGRGEGCEIRLDDEAVSWDHAEIEVRGPSLLCSDLDSRNGTLVNGEPLTRTRRLRSGDVITIGAHRLEVAIPPQQRHESTVALTTDRVKLSDDERAVAHALVAPYSDPGVRAGRPATRAEVAAELHVSERTVQRRLDALAQKLQVPADAGRERPRLIAERILELGLGPPG